MFISKFENEIIGCFKFAVLSVIEEIKHKELEY